MSLEQRTLVVRDIDGDQLTAELLEELFSNFGPVVRVVLRKSFAFIEFTKVESVGYAWAMSEGICLHGKRIRVMPKHEDDPRFYVYRDQLQTFENRIAADQPYLDSLLTAEQRAEKTKLIDALNGTGGSDCVALNAARTRLRAYELHFVPNTGYNPILRTDLISRRSSSSRNDFHHHNHHHRFNSTPSSSSPHHLPPHHHHFPRSQSTDYLDRRQIYDDTNGFSPPHSTSSQPPPQLPPDHHHASYHHHHHHNSQPNLSSNYWNNPPFPPPPPPPPHPHAWPPQPLPPPPAQYPVDFDRFAHNSQPLPPMSYNEDFYHSDIPHPNDCYPPPPPPPSLQGYSPYRPY